MMKNSTHSGRLVVARAAAVCAAWALLAAPAAAQIWGDEGGPEVNVTDYGTVDLAVQDTDLAQVLEMLSIQGRKNIITSKNVSATVSANLYDVTFYEALEAILSVNGYGYTEEGNFIYIFTQEELAEIQAASRKTESRIFELEYLSALDANEFIAPLLSDAGKASSRGDVQTGFQPDVSDGGADSYAYNAKLVVNDYPENLEAIGTLLAELDLPPQQVLMEATILQTTLDETNSYGVDFSVIADMDFIDLTNPLAPVNNLLAGSDTTTGYQPPDNRAGGLQSTVGNTVGAGGFKVGVITDEISAFVKLLDEVTDVSVLARPKIMALNRQRAEVLVGARVGYLSTTSTQTTTTQTVQFLDTGIKLVFRPFISKNGMIRLELSPSVSEASLRTVTDAQGLQVTIPDELTNELTTNVRIKEGQTLVLGGLFRESIRVSQRQVPWVGDIPIAGLLFRGQDDVVDRDEIIFMITPSIVHDQTLWAIGDEGLTYADAMRVGARKGLLPFSRAKITGNYNEDAQAAYRRGDLSMAVHWINTSLNVNPNQPAMIKLRQEVTGRRGASSEDSILEQAFRSQLGPLPRQSSQLPQEVAFSGGNKSRRALNWLPTPQPLRPKPARATDAKRPQEDDMDGEMFDDEMGDDESRPNDDDSAMGPGAAIRPSGAPEAAHVPDVTQPGFWRAADDPGGFDDPAWRSTDPFVTFEDVLEETDVDPGNRS